MLLRNKYIIPFAVSILFLFASCEDKVPHQKTKSTRPRQESAEPIFKKEGVLFFLGQSGDTLKTIDIEIAETQQETAQGLMYRKNMTDDQGMLFIFPRMEPRSFWMKNTHIPLDIIFIDDQSQIVTIQKNTTPFSEQPIPSYQNAIYVVEVIAGFCDYYNIQKGFSIQFQKN